MTSLPAVLPTETNPISLEERRNRIAAVLNEASLIVGRELIAAKAEHPGTFVSWVEDELPFGIDKAERLMAITRAFASSDDKIRAALPSAYSALYELSRMPTDRLRDHIANGDIGPGTTVRDCRQLVNGAPPADEPILPPIKPEPRIGAEVMAKELMRHPRGDLSDTTTAALYRWLG
jgi:hypothetical protein